MLGDGHVRLDFQPRDDGRLQPFRRRLHFVQQTVNAVAQPESFAQRFQMNVRGAQFERVRDDLVHQPDERRVRVHHRTVVAHFAGGHFDFALGQFLDGLVHHRVALAAVIFAQRGLNVLLRGHAQFDFRVQQMGQ